MFALWLSVYLYDMVIKHSVNTHLAAQCLLMERKRQCSNITSTVLCCYSQATLDLFSQAFPWFLLAFPLRQKPRDYINGTD